MNDVKQSPVEVLHEIEMPFRYRETDPLALEAGILQTKTQRWKRQNTR